MAYRTSHKKVARIRIQGPDKKGIIATMTGFLFKNQCNIEDIDQRILEDYLVMNMLVDMSAVHSEKTFETDLVSAAKSVGCKAQLRLSEKRQRKHVAILVTKESHCLVDLLKHLKKNKSGEVACIVGNHPDLKTITERSGTHFFYIPSDRKKEHEEKVLKILDKYQIDLVILARYMQILSPEFVFRYEGKIINIHPSLLPAFPGPRSYHQAFNKGVEWVGVTAHFVTTDLDEGPIICQEAIRVDKTKESVETLIIKGQRMEAKCLTRAVHLFLQDRLCLRRGKVVDNKKLHDLKEQSTFWNASSI